MKKLLIIGASVLQLPAIRRAKELGLCVAVADYNPTAVGVAHADKYYNASTIDESAIVAAALDFQPDGIMTLATDMPMRSVAAACKAMGLPGISPETALKATDKGEMIKAFEANGVAHPWYFLVSQAETTDSIEDSVTYPCIVKPTDNSGSRGVVLVRTPQELRKAYAYSREQSRGGAVIVEEFMQGPEVSVEVIVADGTVHILAVTDKITTGDPHFVEMGHTQPSRLNAESVEAIKTLTVKAVKAVGITKQLNSYIDRHTAKIYL